MIKGDDLKIGTYITHPNKDGRLVLKIINIEYNNTENIFGDCEDYLCELIEGKLYNDKRLSKEDINRLYYKLSFNVLKYFEIAIDYMRETRLNEIGIV